MSHREPEPLILPDALTTDNPLWRYALARWQNPAVSEDVNPRPLGIDVDDAESAAYILLDFPFPSRVRWRASPCNNERVVVRGKPVTAACSVPDGVALGNVP